MTMSNNPLQRLAALGQSVWLDYIERGFVRNGELARMIEQDSVTGLTSNPVIFEKAIGYHHEYDDAIAQVAGQSVDSAALYESLAMDDIVRAANLLRPVYDRSGGHDGFVSFEVSPLLARDTNGTYEEAKRLWQKFEQPNVMIKIPATREGLPAIRKSIADGININVTLIFSVERYTEVLDAYLSGLEDRVKTGGGIERIASVASFFLSRIDTLIDSQLDALKTEEAKRLRGKFAIVSAQLAYERYQAEIAGPRWQALKKAGAQTQRLLWASTGTKDPSYSPTKYVDALIAPDTVTTLPPETLSAYREKGQPAVRIRENLDEARALQSRLKALGIDVARSADQLEAEGLQKFVEPYQKLLKTLASRSTELAKSA